MCTPSGCGTARYSRLAYGLGAACDVNSSALGARVLRHLGVPVLSWRSPAADTCLIGGGGGVAGAQTGASRAEARPRRRGWVPVNAACTSACAAPRPSPQWPFRSPCCCQDAQPGRPLRLLPAHRAARRRCRVLTAQPPRAGVAAAAAAEAKPVILVAEKLGKPGAAPPAKLAGHAARTGPPAWARISAALAVESTTPLQFACMGCLWKASLALGAVRLFGSTRHPTPDACRSALATRAGGGQA